jgi:large subunit ribosomal protein L3
MTGHFNKYGVSVKKHLAEFRTEAGESYEAGQTITWQTLKKARLLDVTGVSKGKGTQGNIKRHNHQEDR